MDSDSKTSGLLGWVIAFILTFPIHVIGAVCEQSWRHLWFTMGFTAIGMVAVALYQLGGNEEED
jgi:bacteriorhodopsin